MGPLQAEAVLLEEVGFTLLTRTDARELGVEVARVFVALDVARSGGGLPGAQRVDAARQREVHVLSQREVVAEIAEEEAPLPVFAVGRHQKARFGPRTDREKSFGNTEYVDRDIFHDQIGGSRDDFLAGNDLGLGHCKIEVRVVGLVAGRIFAALDVDVVVGHLLHAAADEPAVTLLCRDTLDLRLARLEIVGDRIHHVGRCGAFGELRPRRGGNAVDGVGLAVGIDLLGLHVHPHEVRLEVHVLIGDVSLVVDIDHLVADVIDQRVGIFSAHDVFEEGSAALFAPGRVAARRVAAHAQ